MSARRARKKPQPEIRSPARRSLKNLDMWAAVDYATGLLEEALRATSLIGKAFFDNPEGPPRGPSLSQRYLAAARALIAAGKQAGGPQR